jgi:hypothetical protein
MQASQHRPLHPLNVISGISVILFCGAGMAGIMGWLPDAPGAGGAPGMTFAGSPAGLAKVAALQAAAPCRNCGNIESTRVLSNRSATAEPVAARLWLEPHTTAERQVEVRVRLDDGSVRTFYLSESGWRDGARVKVADGVLLAAN